MIVRQISRGDSFNTDVVLVTAATFEPITTQEAKDHLRVAHDDDDIEIGVMVRTATTIAEALTGMRLCSQTVDIIADNWEALADPNNREILRLSVAPVTSVSSVKYYDGDDADTTMSSTLYWTDTNSVPARIQVKSSWPSTNERIGNIRIRCVVGYSSKNAVPPHFKSAIKLIVGHLYENREQVTDLNLRELPMGIYDLLQSHPAYHHYATGALIG